MKILQIDKFFYNRGGSSKVYFETIYGLRERGHEVIEFSVQNEKNFESAYSKYFISSIPELKGPMSVAEKWRVFKHLFYSKEVVQKLEELIKIERPEVAHLHNVYHHLSVSTFETLSHHCVPIVLTLHDVFPLCPNHSLLRGEHLDVEAYKNKIYNCVRYKCVDDKFLLSVAGTLEAYYYRYKHIWDRVDSFLCPSEFMKNIMVEFGFPERKMLVVRNPYEPVFGQKPLGKKIAYVGRLHAEKGIKVFMEAIKGLKDLEFVIAGDGPEKKWVEDFVNKNNLKNVELRGWQDEKGLEKVYEESKVVVVPSVFLENCSIVILEALSRQRIVVASNRGGNPELIKEDKTGYLFIPENSEDLTRAIIKAAETSEEKAEYLAMNAQNMIRERHDPNRYFSELLKVYKDAVSTNLCDYRA